MMRFLPVFALMALLSGVSFLSGVDERSSAWITNQIETIFAEDIAGYCRGRISYPPDRVLLRVFKQERECEVWASNGSREQLRLIHTFPVCAMDFNPGPKLKEDDCKTPEGFYRAASWNYSSSNWFMWMKLEADKISDSGSVGRGSCFNICIDYPQPVNKAMTKSAGYTSPGGAICIHGNCVSIGCVSFANADFCRVFAFARHHDKTRYGELPVHILPFRFEKTDEETRRRLAGNFNHSERYQPEKVLTWWKNLEVIDTHFRETHTLFPMDNSGRLKQGWKSSEIVHLKEALKKAGLFSGVVDHEFTPELSAAVKRFQSISELPVDGIPGEQTLKKIGLENFEGYQYR